MTANITLLTAGNAWSMYTRLFKLTPNPYGVRNTGFALTIVV